MCWCDINIQAFLYASFLFVSDEGLLLHTAFDIFKVSGYVVSADLESLYLVIVIIENHVSGYYDCNLFTITQYAIYKHRDFCTITVEPR